MPCKLDGFVRKRLITATLWVQFFAMARWKTTCHGSSRKTETWTGQLLSFEISFGQKRPWAKTPRVKPPNFQSCSWSTRSKTTSEKYQHALRELGWSTFGKMCLPRVQTERWQWIVWCTGSQTLVRCKDSGSSRFHTCIEVKAKDLVS